MNNIRMIRRHLPAIVAVWLALTLGAEAAENSKIVSENSRDPNAVSYEPIAAAAVATLDKPDVRPLGGRGVFLTQTRSKTIRDFEADPQLAAQITGYGDFYRQLIISYNAGSSTAADTGAVTGNPARTIDCGKSATHPVAKFLGAIFGYKKDRTASLLMSVAVPASSGGGQRVIYEDLPVLAMTRNNLNKCSYADAGDVDLTPFIAAAANDRLTLTFKVKITKASRVNFNALVGLIGEVAQLASQDATDGIVGDATELAASGLNAKINEFFAAFDTDQSFTTSRMLPLGAEASYNHDMIVLTFGRPQNEGSFDTISFDAAPSLTVRLGYAPTLFAKCGVQLKSCSGRYDSPAQILRKRASTRSLHDIAMTDPDASNPNVDSLVERLITENAKLDPAQRKAGIGRVCDDLKDAAKFPPALSLNLVDQLIVRHTLLGQHTQYLRDRRINSPECFKVIEQEKLVSLGPQDDPRFAFPRPTAETVYARSNEISEALRGGPSGKALVMGEGGRLAIQLPQLLNSSSGQEIRPETGIGLAAAKTLESIRFTLEAACPEQGIDPSSNLDADTLFGFLQRVVDLDSQSRVTEPTFVPIVVSVGSQALPVKSLTIHGSLESYYRALNRPISENPWQHPCFQALQAQSTGAKAAFDQMFEAFSLATQ